MTIYKYTFKTENDMNKAVDLANLICDILVDFEIITNNVSDVEIQILFDDNEIQYTKVELNV